MQKEINRDMPGLTVTGVQESATVPAESPFVKAWHEKVVIPTYPVGKPEKNPMFLEKRVYQGSSGVVYPYPVIERIFDAKEEREYNALFLENPFLKIMILPELGGRVQMAWDKLKQRHFVYYNQVIKPALVGLTGPWISGGIEFNWPQHHRPTTFSPVDYSIEMNEDNSVTVWCNEYERMFHTQGAAGFTLYPDRAYLEIRVRLVNRTDFPQTFLWWANPAVKVNDHYQSVFPPDVQAVFDHGKRDVSKFPIADGIYYKVDYSPGTDISMYKNIPVPTSFMAVSSEYDFIGGYEHDTKGGMLHVANHHLSPGKKQWTWGNGEFGRAWDRNLTDQDGPYIELMCGVFTDNQPDFSWLMPGETKTFTQYFMPYRDLGKVKNATRDAMVNLEITGDKALIRAYTTRAFPGATVRLCNGSEVILEKNFDFHPGTSFSAEVKIPVTSRETGSLVDSSPEEGGITPPSVKGNLSSGLNGGKRQTAPLPEAEDAAHRKFFPEAGNATPGGAPEQQISIALFSAEGQCLVSWKPETGPGKSIPEPAKAPERPEKVTTNEKLYLIGLHLEQYRHATFDPRDYYLEALRRDSSDSRCNNAMGLWLLRRGRFLQAADYFRKAIQTLTALNPNPIDGESHYNLGLSLLFSGREEEAYAAFYKSVWNAHWAENGWFQIARIEMKNGRWPEALEAADLSLARNGSNPKARLVKSIILRNLDRREEALRWIDESLKKEPFNYALWFEKFLLTDDADAIEQMKTLMRRNIHTTLEFALDYLFAGQYGEAIRFMDTCTEGLPEMSGALKPMPGTATVAVIPGTGAAYPMTLYLKAWCAFHQGREEVAREFCKEAAMTPPDFCFPNRPEESMILEWAVKFNPGDARAPYYLANLQYNARIYEHAIANWERSASLDPSFPTVHRNLALAWFNKRHDASKAREYMEKAFALDPSDARMLMELDQLRKRLNDDPRERLLFLENHPLLVESRDDLFLERIALLNALGKHHKAYQLVMSRKFHPWEGGEGKVTGQYVWSLTEIAKAAIRSGKYAEALNLLNLATHYPENLGEGKLAVAQENEIEFWTGVAADGLGDREMAVTCWRKASTGLAEPSAAMFYNDQQPDTIFYQGMALKMMDQPGEAANRFRKLRDYGKNHLNDQITMDYFAVSFPDILIWEDDLDKRNHQLCLYLMGLGELGAGNIAEAENLFREVLENDQIHRGALVHLAESGISGDSLRSKITTESD